ncbi:hypothetical protein BGZ60DRAFT_371286 [Tricladium varicosporioides]|nr:hypothetical protein BGZ60DRAFT_371286 [Hymenoscyphus varicosporioides]
MPADNPSAALSDVPARRVREVVPATYFAPIYRSIFTLTPPGNTLIPLLRHVNCSYLSTAGIAPSLLELKQHAQALTILIKNLTLSTLPGVIDNENSELGGIPRFNDGETYDWLNNLSQRYEGPQNEAMRKHHLLPLTSLLNVLEEKNAPAHGAQPARVEYRSICPLHRANEETLPPQGQSLPYATHQALIEHANEVLELLDHEYSAKGGLLGILPKRDEKEDRASAEKTLLGQLVLYIQRLVQRLHDLERQYANAMDVLASEATVPHQTLSAVGPDGRSGREVVYPQGRFVLVNAGEDLWSFLNAEFEKKERVDEKVMENYKTLGVTGEALWQERGGKEMSRGITVLDVMTRYYRLRKDPLKTIFVIPAHSEHPGTKVTREIEKQPTVVSVVKPVWPSRMSSLEQKHRSDMIDLKRLRAENQMYRDLVDWNNKERTVLNFQSETQGAEVRAWKKKHEEVEAELNTQPNTSKKSLAQQKRAVEKEKEEIEILRKKLEERQAELNRKEAERVEQEKEALRARHARNLDLQGMKEDFDKQCAIRLSQIERADQQAGRVADELAAKLEATWRKQIVEQQILNNHLREHNIQLGDEAISEVAIAKGTEEGYEKVEAATRLHANEKIAL